MRIRLGDSLKEVIYAFTSLKIRAKLWKTSMVEGARSLLPHRYLDRKTSARA